MALREKRNLLAQIALKKKTTEMALREKRNSLAQIALKGQEESTSFRCSLVWGLMPLSALLTSMLTLQSGPHWSRMNASPYKVQAQPESESFLQQLNKCHGPDSHFHLWTKPHVQDNVLPWPGRSHMPSPGAGLSSTLLKAQIERVGGVPEGKKNGWCSPAPTPATLPKGINWLQCFGLK